MSELTTILVVDDDPINRSVLFFHLDHLGYRVLIAEDGEAAVDIVQLVHPNLILMDILLPGMDGYSACRQIQEQPGGKEIPVLFMSGLDDDQSRIDSFAVGGSAHLTKPIFYAELDALLAVYLERQYLKSQLSATLKRVKVAEPLTEFDRMIDYIVHDMKSALLGVSGFADELMEQFAEQGAAAEWQDFGGLIQKSAHEADMLLDSLVLLKNLRTVDSGAVQPICLAQLMQQVESRYRSAENALPVHCRMALDAAQVMGEPILLEELFLILWRILAGLNPSAADWRLDISCQQEPHSPVCRVLLDATSRPVSEQELPLLLAPVVENRRKKVKDTNILTICAQKMIQLLGIQAVAQRTAAGLRFQLTLPAPPVRKDNK